MVEFDDLLVTTGVDALVKLVKDAEKIDIETASKELKIPVDTLEDWARVLEEEGIIRVQYKLAKVYLIWVTPTEEEIAAEKESFMKSKAELQKEIEEVREKIKPHIEEMSTLKNTFDKFYEETYGKLDQMEKKLSSTVVSGAISDEKFENQAEKVNDILQTVKLLKANMKTIKSDVAEMEKSVKKSKSGQSVEKMEKLKGEISSMMSEMADLKKKMAAETTGLTKGVKLPSTAEMKTKFDSIMKDFKDVKRRNAELRDDLRNLEESYEIVGTVGKELKTYEKDAASLKKDLSKLSKQSEKLFTKTKEVNEKLKGNLDTIERFSDSLDIAKTIVTKFPSQKKLSSELKALSKKEKDIEEKTTTVKKLLQMMGGKKVTAKHAMELSKQVDEKLEELRAESEELTEALESDKSTYMTFQQIKERIVPSIEKYNKEVDRLESDLQNIKKNAADQQKMLKEEAKKFKETVKKGEVKSMVSFARDIKDKKKSLDDIKETLSGLADTADNINKRLVLLSREAKLLELRAAKGEITPEEAAKKEKIVKDQIKLTKEEEVEFKRKRAELKKLIQKLWEEQ